MAKKTTKKKATKKAAPRGRPTKINDTRIEIALRLFQKGMTDVEAAEILGICERTLNNWKTAYPDLKQSISSAKKEVDDEVEKKLLENCLGYEEETEIAKVVGNKLKRMKLKRKVKGETSAQIFWLKNRQPKRWQEKYTVSGNDGDDKPIDEMSNEELLEEIRYLSQQLENESYDS